LTTSSSRVAIIGLDGVPWEALEVLLESGVMPNLKSILPHSARAKLKPLVPITGPSWIDMATTVNPGKHGIFDFLRLEPKDFTWRSNTPLDVKHPRLHEMLAMEGKSSVLINIPYTVPPVVEAPDKYVIFASWLHKKTTEVYPQERMEFLRGDLAELRKKIEGVFGIMDLEAYLEAVKEQLEAKLSIAEKLLEFPWNLYFVIFSESDWIFHRIYGEILKRSKLGRKADAIFSLMDEFIGKAVELLSDEGLLMVVSDHGFAEHKRALNVNVLLKKLGYLKVSESVRGRVINKILRMLPSRIKASLKSRALTVLSGIRLQDRAFTMPIDYRNSMAFMQTLCNIYLHPLLKEDEKKRIADEIVHELETYRDLLGGIMRREELYSGPYVREAPEIVVFPGELTISARMVSDKVVDEGLWYSHSLYGIFIAYGREVVSREHHVVSSFDVGATALFYLGCPLPSTCDGKPLKDIFSPTIASREVLLRNYASKYAAALKVKQMRKY